MLPQGEVPSQAQEPYWAARSYSLSATAAAVAVEGFAMEAGEEVDMVVEIASAVVLVFAAAEVVAAEVPFEVAVVGTADWAVRISVLIHRARLVH